MSVSLPHPSSRFLRAAAAEHADLGRHRERLSRRRETLLSELRQVDEALAAVSERLGALAQLTAGAGPAGASGGGAPAAGAPGGGAAGAALGGVPAAGEAEERDRSAAPAAPQAPDVPVTVLRGPAIRETAVRVLLAQPQRIEALHYRRWYELLGAAGYTVAGKDPMAVFLTQLTRSPVVRKATQPGLYEVDRQAPLRIRQRLERLRTELRELVTAPQTPVDLATVRSRRHELDVAISQQERALEEALRVLRTDAAGAEAAPAGGVRQPR